jgi:nitrogenase subunit NifH
MSERKKIAMENTSLLVDNIIERSVQCLNSGKPVEGIGCLMKKTFEIVPLLYEEENGLSITLYFEFISFLLDSFSRAVLSLHRSPNDCGLTLVYFP